jgi:large subunit ribosomal protein L21
MSNIAVISLAGAQHLVKPGDKLEVNRLGVEVEKDATPEVLLSTKGDEVLFKDGKVETRVVEHKKGEKLYIIKFKAKSRYRRRTGHRQHLSLIEIVSINGEKAEAKAVTKSANADVATETVAEVKAPKKAATKKPAAKKPAAKKTTKKEEAK